MIVGEVERHELREHGLGGINPPKDVALALAEIRKELELIWNSDDNQWEIYRQYKGKLVWQNSAPVKGSEITPGIKTWLQKYDTSQGGVLGEEERRREFSFILKDVFAKEKRRRRERQEDVNYEVSSMSKWLMRFASGHRQVVVPAGIVGVTKEGKAIRAYKTRG